MAPIKNRVEKSKPFSVKFNLNWVESDTSQGIGKAKKFLKRWGAGRGEGAANDGGRLRRTSTYKDLIQQTILSPVVL